MFRNLNYLFILSGFVNYFQLISSHLIFSEFYGNLLESTGFNFSVFIRNFRGIVLYSLDTNNNKLLIELDRHANEDIFIIKFNNNSKEETLWSKNICGCTKCSNVFITFVLLLHISQIDVNCQGRSSSIKLDHCHKRYQIVNYPIPRYFKERKYEAYFWIGNVGPYQGDLQYFPLSNQLIGCLEIFNFNGKSLSFTKDSLHVFSTCNVFYTEENIFHDIRKVSTTVYKMYDCSVLSMNGHYCNTDLTKSLSFNHSYKNIRDNNEFTFFRFEWKTMDNNYSSKPYCLLEIYLKDETILFFSINPNNNLLINMFINNQTIIKFQQIVPVESKQILLIYFEGNYLIVKIFDGKIIRIYREQLLTRFILANVGFCRHSSEYSEFIKNFSFKYDNSSWVDSNRDYQKNTTPNLVQTIIIVLIVVIGMITVTAIVLIFCFKRGKKSNENIKRNRKTPSPNQYELELNEANNNGNIYDTIHVNEKPCEDDDDHNEYSII